MTPEQAAIVRAAAEAEAQRCTARAADFSACGPQWASHAEWWCNAAAIWTREAERRIALGYDACNGWCGVRLERAA